MGLRNPDAYTDRSEVWEAEHYRRRCLAVAPLVSDELIDEHRQNPFGYRDHHSLALQRVDRLLKTYPADGRRLVPVVDNDGEWRVMTFTRFGEPTVGDDIYESLDDAVHAVFLTRLEVLKRVIESETR